MFKIILVRIFSSSRATTFAFGFHGSPKQTGWRAAIWNQLSLWNLGWQIGFSSPRYRPKLLFKFLRELFIVFQISAHPNRRQVLNSNSYLVPKCDLVIVWQLGTRLRKCSFFYFFFVLGHVFIKQGKDCAKPRLQNSLALSTSLPSTAPKVLELQLPPYLPPDQKSCSDFDENFLIISL